MSDAAIRAYARDVRTLLNLVMDRFDEMDFDDLVVMYGETRARVVEMTERILLSE